MDVDCCDFIGYAFHISHFCTNLVYLLFSGRGNDGEKMILNDIVSDCTNIQ